MNEGTGGNNPPKGFLSHVQPAPCQHKFVWLREGARYSRLGRGGYFYFDLFFCEKCLVQKKVDREKKE